MHGFSYSNDDDSEKEFASAAEYFRLNPNETKLPINYSGELINPITHSSVMMEKYSLFHMEKMQMGMMPVA